MEASFKAAVANNAEETLRHLDEVGIDVNAVHACFDVPKLTYYQSIGGETDYCARFMDAAVLHVAVYFRSSDVVAALLARGADVGATCEIRFGLASKLDGEYSERTSSGPAIKWRYHGVNALHIAASGEEVDDRDGEEQTMTHLLLHVRRKMREGHDMRSVVEAPCKAIEWWFRGGPHWRLDGATPLHTAIFHFHHFPTDRGDDILDLIVHVHADRTDVRFKSIADDVSNLCDGNVSLEQLNAIELSDKMRRKRKATPHWHTLDLAALEACRAHHQDGESMTAEKLVELALAASAAERRTWPAEGSLRVRGGTDEEAAEAHTDI